MASLTDLYENAMQFATTKRKQIEQQPSLLLRATAAAHLIDCDNFHQSILTQKETINEDLQYYRCCRAKDMLSEHLFTSFISKNYVQKWAFEHLCWKQK